MAKNIAWSTVKLLKGRSCDYRVYGSDTPLSVMSHPSLSVFLEVKKNPATTQTVSIYYLLYLW